MKEHPGVALGYHRLVQDDPRGYVQRPLGVVLAGARPPLYQVPEEGRPGGEDRLVTGQLELGPEAVLGAAAVGSLVVAVRGEDEGRVRVVARVQEVAQVVLQRVRSAKLLAQTAQQARLEGRVVRANVPGVQVPQQRREYLHFEVRRSLLQANASAVAWDENYCLILEQFCCNPLYLN